MQSALQAITHPPRRQILRLVWDAELSSQDIAAHFDVTWQAVSHNLRVLREAGLLSERKDGTRRFYRAEPAGVAPLEALLRDLWAQDLEKLGDVIDRSRKERR